MGCFVAADGTPLQVGPRASVQPWHPVNEGPEQVRAWRDFFVERGMKQPFRQAFRQIYLLTPAEEQALVYSNRFASHILNYQQVFALMKARRWASNYLGPYEGRFEGTAVREFGPYGLSAQFFFEAVEDDQGEERVLYCTTDQVRLVRTGDRNSTPVPLRDVPDVVFSEAMRDVDLFVGVTSIAADPTWSDRGVHRYLPYWQSVAFGDLTSAGLNRREVVAQLLPKLKMRDRCRLEGNYLVVRGRLHEYKIHLGTGNVLMSPDDRYL
jgi:hypothetical protein